jgi:flagellar biosynthetic protein FlhB
MPGERTEQATQHRREKARKEGDILHSRELAAAAGTLAGVMALGVFAGRAMEAWRGAFADFLSLGAVANWETALEDVIAQLESPSNSLFSKLQ